MRKDGRGSYREAVSYIQKVSAIFDKKLIVGSLASYLYRISVKFRADIEHIINFADV
jgi:hypothetical protein